MGIYFGTQSRNYNFIAELLYTSMEKPRRKQIEKIINMSDKEFQFAMGDWWISGVLKTLIASYLGISRETLSRMPAIGVM